MPRPYEQFTAEELILRDHLAIDRTVLANERTLLAYARTALALVVSGVSFIEAFESPITAILGWLFIPLGVVTMGLGCRRYLSMRVRAPSCSAEEAAEHHGTETEQAG